jgi:fibrillarin-like rRNA methylase
MDTQQKILKKQVETFEEEKAEIFVMLKNISFDLKTLRDEQRKLQAEVENINTLINNFISTPEKYEGVV